MQKKPTEKPTKKPSPSPTTTNPPAVCRSDSVTQTKIFFLSIEKKCCNSKHVTVKSPSVT